MFHQLYEMLSGVNKNIELTVLQVWFSLEEERITKSQSLDNNVSNQLCRYVHFKLVTGKFWNGKVRWY